MNSTQSEHSEVRIMLYASAFVLGLLGGSAAVLIIRWLNSRRRKTYGFKEKPEEAIPFYIPDEQSKYSNVAASVDGSEAVREFRN